ncbi:MAG: MFS transporter [Candidatus Gracilibacteria bacterium]
MKEMFSNKSLNKLHFQYGLVRLGGQFVGTFGVIILYNMGYPLWQAILFGAIYPCGEFLFRLIVLPFFSRFGLKRTILFGAMTFVLVAPTFYLATLSIIPVWIYLILWSFAAAFYWYSFHIIYGLVGDQEKRGRQSAIKEGVAQIAYSLGPILGGVIFKFFGAPGLLLSGAISFALALIVLLKVDEYPNIKVKQGIKTSFKNTPKRGLFINGCFAFQEVFINELWILVLFFLFHEDTVMMGGLLSLVMILRIGVEYFVGGTIDFQHKTRWYQWGAVIIAISVIGRALFGFTVDIIIFSEILLIMGFSLFSPYGSVFSYNSVKESEYPESFALLYESGWDFGSIIAYVLAVFLVYYHVEIRYLTIIGIIVLPFVVLVYRDYFREPRMMEVGDEFMDTM